MAQTHSRQASEKRKKVKAEARSKRGRQPSQTSSLSGPEGFKSNKIAVAVRRRGTREKVTALEDRPGRTAPRLTEEPTTFLTEEGDVTGKKESLFQKEGEAPPSAAESIAKSIGIGAAIGVSVYGGGRLVTAAIRGGARLIASQGLTSRAVGQAAKGIQLSKFGRIIRPTDARIATHLSEFGGVLKNTSTAKKGISLLAKVAKGGKYALGTIGILSGIAFAGQFLATQTYNDSADAIDGYKFAISAADRDDDEEEIMLLGEELDELYSVWEETDGFGIFNYPKAANSKIQQAKDVADSVRRRRGLQ